MTWRQRKRRRCARIQKHSAAQRELARRMYNLARRAGHTVENMERFATMICDSQVGEDAYGNIEEL